MTYLHAIYNTLNLFIYYLQTNLDVILKIDTYLSILAFIFIFLKTSVSILAYLSLCLSVLFCSYLFNYLSIK